MNILKIILGLLTFVTIYSCSQKDENKREKFHGMWRLDKYESFDSISNTWRQDSTTWGQDTSSIDGSGYIMYDGEGHMAVHLTPKGYKDFDTKKNIDSLNNEDLKKLIKFYQSNFVYFANVELTDSTVVHKRLSATEPRNWNTKLVRDYEFRQDTLILAARESISGKRLRLRWIKLK